jgi:sugar (pentulose or hexulose) kinase
VTGARFVLGHDVGTSGDKAVLCDLDGRTVATASRTYGLHRPKPGWVEQDPEGLLHAVVSTSRELAAAARERGGEVVAIGVSGQMFNVVAVDGAGNHVSPLISWLDTRADEQAERLTDGAAFDEQFERFGNVFTAKDIAPKILWLRDEHPAAADEATAFLDCKDYVNARLTGVRATDHAGASATFLYDVERRRWDAERCEAAGVQLEGLPEVRSATASLGSLSGAVADAIGVAAGTQVVVDAGDVPAGQVGAGASRPGQTHLSLGTASYFGVSLDRPLHDPGRRLGVLCHMDPTRWLLWAEMETGGGALAWWRDVIGGVDGARASPAELDRLAVHVRPEEVGVLFAPWLTGERVPLWDDHARGAFVGIGIEHGLPHLTRAVIEGIAYQLRWVLEYAEAFGVSIDEIRLIGGHGLGGVLPQVVADVLGRPLDLVADPQHAGARGAALCALAACGLGDLDALADATPLAGRIDPEPHYRGLYDERFGRFVKLRDRLAPIVRPPATRPRKRRRRR